MAEIPKALSISFRCDDGCVEHNNRDFFTDNVDKNRTADNITYVKRNLRELYHELFDEVLTEYNAKQSRKDRIISDYYEHIRLGKKEKLFQEVIVMFGNSDDCGVGSENWQTAIDLLDNYMQEFEKRNPNLKVFNAVMHLDEATPHLHINFVPVCYNQKQGLHTRVSMKRAIQQMGFSASGKKETEAILWGNSERKKLTEILNRNDIHRKVVGAFYDHKPLKEYKELAGAIRAQNEHISALKKKNPVDLTAVDVEEILNQNDYLRDKITEQSKDLAKYRAQSAARLVPIEFYNDEKRQYILEKLRKQNVQFVEDNSVIYVPEHYAKPVEDIAATFKPSVNSQTMREKLKFTLDRLVYTAVSFGNMLELLEQMGYGVKRGKFTAIKPPYAQRFMRLQSLGEGYSEFELKQRIEHRNEIPDDFKQSEEYYANALEKPFYGAMNSVITLVRTFAFTPTKKDTSRAYSFKNDKTIDSLCCCLGTLSEFNIHSREELYKAAENLQTRIDNCSDDERDDLQIQHARISSVIRTYEEIIDGNYIDNLIRAEKEHREALERAEERKTEQKQEPTQTVNRKPKKFGRH